MLSETSWSNTVIIISSRANTEESRRITLAELEGYKIRHKGLYLLDQESEARHRCPHSDLDWYQKYLWQKIEICQREQIDVFFDDDQKVVELFKRFAPEILVLQVHGMTPQD